jgi:hypothetical protein
VNGLVGPQDEARAEAEENATVCTPNATNRNGLQQVAKKLLQNIFQEAMAAT